MTQTYVATIGLEIHAELSTKSKMFCGSDNYSPPGTEPNINTCEICTGQPGVLPVLNKEAIDATIKVGLALNCGIAELTKWDRKQYFYPDLPKGYQISQYDVPLTHKGKLKLSDGKTIGITRIHLEEDTGKLTHVIGRTYQIGDNRSVSLDKNTGEVRGIKFASPESFSLVDFNRAGTPLLELVTEPDFENAQEAKEFAKMYQSILRYLKVSNADMEKGEMRVEANVSVARTLPAKGAESVLGTKVEVKNINSFKAVERAIEYEIKRQIEVLEGGGKVLQETRGWSEPKQKTFAQRIKETAADYRYFPEPDLPEVEIEKKWIDELKSELPELPDYKMSRYIKELGIGKDEAWTITADTALVGFFEKVVENGADPKTSANWIANELVGRLNKAGIGVAESSTNPRELAVLIKKVVQKEITGTVAKSVLDKHLATGDGIEQIISRETLSGLAEDELAALIKKVVESNPKPANEFRQGKEASLKFLIGQVMKETRGQADPERVSEMLKKVLG